MASNSSVLSAVSHDTEDARASGESIRDFFFQPVLLDAKGPLRIEDMAAAHAFCTAVFLYRTFEAVLASSKGHGT